MRDGTGQHYEKDRKVWNEKGKNHTEHEKKLSTYTTWLIFLNDIYPEITSQLFHTPPPFVRYQDTNLESENPSDVEIRHLKGSQRVRDEGESILSHRYHPISTYTDVRWTFRSGPISPHKEKGVRLIWDCLFVCLFLGRPIRDQWNEFSSFTTSYKVLLRKR